MADGGMSCDNDAYLVQDECPSSMVGVVSVFEAVLLHTPRGWTEAERHFLDRAARFLIGRELRLGSATKHNAAEQVSAAAWTKPCFPRFYFYDVLRGLSALVLWAEKTESDLPRQAVRVVVDDLSREFGDGPVRIGRRAYEGMRTIGPTPAGAWTRQEATTFPLLDAVSTVGTESPFLSRQWAETKGKLERRLVAGS